LRINYGAVLQSCLIAVLVFSLINSAAEYCCYKLSGISVVHTFEQKMGIHFGRLFHAIELMLFGCETYMVFIFYALIRPAFTSTIKPALITIIFSLLGIAFFLGHIINLGIYPFKTGMVFLITTACAYPPSIFLGAFIYDKSGLR
jgi:hypothetical protein